MHDAYAARLLTSRNDIDRLQRDLALLRTRITSAQDHAAQLDAARTSAQHAWQTNTLEWPTYLAIRAHALAADLQLLSLRQQRDPQAIALATELGGRWNPAASGAPQAIRPDSKVKSS